jgi:catecholate siderophore receptor
VVRYAYYYTREFRISEPIISAPAGTPLSQIPVNLNIWSGNGVETMAWDQAEGTAIFSTGEISHTVVAGIEGGRESSAPEFDNSSGVPPVPLLSPDPNRPFVAAATYPRLIGNTIAWSFAPYVLDTIKWGDQIELTGGIRWDYFATRYRATRYSVTSPGMISGFDNVPRVDTQPDYRAAIVYKPAPNGSVYADFGTSFDPSAESLSQITSGRSLAISNADLAPEKNRTIDFGSKWDVFSGQLSLTGSVFREQKLNAREPDPNNPGFNMLAGTQQVDGLSLGATGRLTGNWQIVAGYTYLDGKVTKSAPGAAPVGSSLPNTPRNSLSLFTEYRLGGGFEIGGGGEYESARLAQNTAPLRGVPGYWTFDLMGKYDISEKWSLQLNVTNLLDTVYYGQIHPFHVVPGAGRTGLLTLNFRM